jgi:hypothetical protein
MLLVALTGAMSLTLDRTRDADVDRLYDLYDLVSLVLLVPSILGYLVAATAVIVWLWLARTNAEIIDTSPFVHDGAAQRYGRPWVIAGWFVPFANYFIPRQIVGDIWSASASGRGMGLVNAWWTLWILFTLSNIGQLRQYETEVDALFGEMRFSIVQGALGVVAAILAILVVRRISEYQAAHASKIATLVSGAATP